MSIDWSKAPEGCIGAFARIISKTAFFVFSKRPSDYSSREGYEGEGEDGPYHVFSEYWEWIDKPWDGQGLPPVGTVCIVYPHNTQWGFNSTAGHERKVLAYHGDFVWLGTENEALEATRTDKVDFEAIHSPEQIAAEEREAGISDMQTITDGAGPTVYAKLSALYDAGYRRQEEGK